MTKLRMSGAYLSYGHHQVFKGAQSLSALGNPTAFLAKMSAGHAQCGSLMATLSGEALGFQVQRKSFVDSDTVVVTKQLPNWLPNRVHVNYKQTRGTYKFDLMTKTLRACFHRLRSMHF